MLFRVSLFLTRFVVGVAFLCWGSLVGAAPVLDRVREKVKAVSAGEEGDSWKIREQAWEGVFEPDKGRAVRLQFFRGKEYLIVFGTSGSKGVHILGIMDRENRVVARSEPGKAGELAVLKFSPEATGAYLILLRADGITSKVPGTMVYAYK